MNVPVVVNTAMKMKRVIATDGPASQSHQLTPRKSCSVSRPGPSVDPERAEGTWRMPLGSLNQFGPFDARPRRGPR